MNNISPIASDASTEAVTDLPNGQFLHVAANWSIMMTVDDLNNWIDFYERQARRCETASPRRYPEAAARYRHSARLLRQARSRARGRGEP